MKNKKYLITENEEEHAIQRYSSKKCAGVRANYKSKVGIEPLAKSRWIGRMNKIDSGRGIGGMNE